MGTTGTFELPPQSTRIQPEEEMNNLRDEDQGEGRTVRKSIKMKKSES